MRRASLALLAAMAVVLPLLPMVAFADDDDESPAEPDDRCDDSDTEAQVLLTCLRNGNWEERSAAIVWLPDALGLTSRRDIPGPWTDEEAVDLLIRVMHEEEDDWIARLLLDDLLFAGAEGIERLFRAALRESSINLRAKAVERLAYQEDPHTREDLESLWAGGVPDWVLPDLVRALARQDLVDYVEDFIDLTKETNPDVRYAAIEALGTLGAEAGRTALLSLARNGPTADRVSALRSLSWLPSTEETVEVMERALRSEEPAIRHAALDALSGMDNEAADAVLMKVLEESADDVDLDLAADGLENSDLADATGAIARVLGRIDLAAHEGLARDIVMTLHNRDDVEALPWLVGLDVKASALLRDDLVKLIGYLSRHRPDERRTVYVSTSCGGVSFGTNPTDPRARRIAPRPPFETVRCWAAPSVAGESWDETRPAAGALVRIEEYFERPEGTWVLADGEDAECWVPMADLAAADTPPPEEDPTRPPRIEFDLPAGELRSRAAKFLIRHGVMTVLEPDSDLDVVAVALSIDPADPEQVALLDEALGGGGEILEESLEDFRSACCGPLP